MTGLCPQVMRLCNGGPLVSMICLLRRGMTDILNSDSTATATQAKSRIQCFRQTEVRVFYFRTAFAGSVSKGFGFRAYGAVARIRHAPFLVTGQSRVLFLPKNRPYSEVSNHIPIRIHLRQDVSNHISNQNPFASICVHFFFYFFF